jgi:pimeloyl-ACP methyl ester carboxylesterase
MSEPSEVASYPGARRPERCRSVDSDGVRIAVYEWGSATATPVLLAHGGFDFAGTFDVFAPMLADAGFRVVSWDHRGHGDSDHSPLYSWAADLRDALVVLNSITTAPIPMVGHSKGGNLLMHLCEARPHRATRFVNIDGMPSRHRAPDVADHERTRMLENEISGWLDRRRRAGALQRKAGSIDDLARRRGRMNPRLPRDWLRYLVPIGARRDPDGWRWKLDPIMRFGGFGPWSPDWYLERLPGFPVPLLGILGLLPEEMGWGTTRKGLARYLPRQAEIVEVEDSGHFVHIEHPRRVADLVIGFLR